MAATARLLEGATAVTTELARSLPPADAGAGVAGPHPLTDAPGEAGVQRAHRLLVELDAELDRSARDGGDRDGPALAGRLRRVVESLRT